MSSAAADQRAPTILIVGASRGLGLAMAAQFLEREWDVIGTVRSGARTGLHDLADDNGSRLRIETLDINVPSEVAALRARLSGRVLDMVFVNAGITTHDPLAIVDDVATDEFERVMVTNALSPMRLIVALQDLVPRDGLIGAMSSGQGSIANNETGLREVYRASKTALNMLMRSFAAREAVAPRAMILMAPGWIRTDRTHLSPSRRVRRFWSICCSPVAGRPACNISIASAGPFPGEVIAGAPLHSWLDFLTLPRHMPRR